MNVTYNPDTERVEWAPYRGDYGAHYATDTIEAIEEHNCVKGCTRAGTRAERDEFGPGGACPILAWVALGEHGRVIPELDPRPDGPHCTARQDPATAGMDRSDPKGWDEPIDREEFERRVSTSTCNHRAGPARAADRMQGEPEIVAEIADAATLQGPELERPVEVPTPVAGRAPTGTVPCEVCGIGVTREYAERTGRVRHGYHPEGGAG